MCSVKSAPLLSFHCERDPEISRVLLRLDSSVCLNCRRSLQPKNGTISLLKEKETVNQRWDFSVLPLEVRPFSPVELCNIVAADL